MKKKTILVRLLALLLLMPFSGRADEGMWLPLLLKQLNESDMQKRGLKLSAEDIYSINKTSLKDAIVLFGGGCTGEMISAEGKWSLKELMQHMLDTERIMTYHALCFARHEQAMLPGFDEDAYAAVSDANRRKLTDILEEYRLQRLSTIALFKSFSPEMIDRFGKANNATYNVRSLTWVIAAHENHHLHIIQTRYLKQEIES